VAGDGASASANANTIASEGTMGEKTQRRTGVTGIPFEASRLTGKGDVVVERGEQGGAKPPTPSV
jgi:hypothetical protein